MSVRIDDPGVDEHEMKGIRRHVTAGASVVTAGLVWLFAIAGCRLRPDSNHSENAGVVTASANTARVLVIGETVRASVAGDEPLICTYPEGYASAGGPCRRFRLLVADPGALDIRLTWDRALPLRLDLKSASGATLTTACCASPLELTTRVEAGGYDLEVILLTQWGEPHTATFEITTWLQHATR
jgi:hypothetical protein